MSMPGSPTDPCPYCMRPIDPAAKKCPECLSDLGPKLRFNLDGWSKLVGFIIALITVISLGSDKLTALYLVISGQDASQINLELTDAQWGDPKPNGESGELTSVTASVTNFGHGPGVLYAQILCLGEDITKGDAHEVTTWRFRAAAPTAIEAGKLTFVVLNLQDRSPIDYGSRETAVAQWRKYGKILPKNTCRFNVGDKHGFVQTGFTRPQQMIAALGGK